MTADLDGQAPLLTTSGLTLSVGSRVLVKDLELSLGPGERLAIVGSNGAGKSTLLSVLAGLAEPSSGRVTRPDDPPGMVFQDGAFWPHMSVEAHLAFVDRHGDGAWRERLLDEFDLQGQRTQRPESLSGGERLRLGLARALAGRPRWVLMDEPLAHLDRGVAVGVREILPALLDELGAALVLVTHDADDVLLFGDRLLSLTGDGSWWQGSARFALESPPTVALAALSERGTLLSAQADGEGRADFGLGLVLDGLPPGRHVSAFLDEAGVRFASGPDADVTGEYVAPDRRGGSWVRVDDRLVRVGQGHGRNKRGDAVGLRVDGRPRPLEMPS
jgi:ABC-type nitrate/sulfonate/bicarbonate transport system ATPase subunit